VDDVSHIQIVGIYEDIFKAISNTIGALTTVSIASAESELEKVMKERGLTQQDILAAAKTYTPMVEEISISYLVQVDSLGRLWYMVFHL